MVSQILEDWILFSQKSQAVFSLKHEFFNSYLIFCKYDNNISSYLWKIGSKEAGAKLFEMLRLGKSKPWKEIMGIMTGTPNMDTGAYREYFAPLEKWLIKQNKEENNQVFKRLRT